MHRRTCAYTRTCKRACIWVAVAHTCAHINAWARTWVHGCVCVYMPAYVRACLHTCACVQMCAHVHVCTRACVRACNACIASQWCWHLYKYWCAHACMCARELVHVRDCVYHPHNLEVVLELLLSFSHHCLVFSLHAHMPVFMHIHVSICTSVSKSLLDAHVRTHVFFCYGMIPTMDPPCRQGSFVCWSVNPSIHWISLVGWVVGWLTMHVTCALESSLDVLPSSDVQLSRERSTVCSSALNASAISSAAHAPSLCARMHACVMVRADARVGAYFHAYPCLPAHPCDF